MSKQRITLYVSEHVWRAVRLYTVGHGISASQFVENVVSNFLMDTDAFERANEVKRADNSAAQKPTPTKPRPNADTAQ